MHLLALSIQKKPAFVWLEVGLFPIYSDIVGSPLWRQRGEQSVLSGVEYHAACIHRPVSLAANFESVATRSEVCDVSLLLLVIGHSLPFVTIEFTDPDIGRSVGNESVVLYKQHDCCFAFHFSASSTEPRSVYCRLATCAGRECTFVRRPAAQDELPTSGYRG